MKGEESQTEKDMLHCTNIMKAAYQEGLLTEVVVWSLQYMQGNRDATIEEALNYGFNEWVK